MPAYPQYKEIHTPENMHAELLAFFNAIDEVFVSYDFVNYKLISISNACEKLFGYTASQLLTNNQLWLKLVHPDDRYIAINEYKALQRGEQVNSQHRIIRSDDWVCWVEKKIVPVLVDGKLVRFDGVIRDITARKEEEERCRNSETMYRQIVETAQEGIWTIDENEKVNFINVRLGDMLGYEPQEMLGKEPYDFMDQKVKADVVAAVERARNGAKENFDAKLITKQGRDVWTKISTNPIFDEAGKYRGILGMVTDMTITRSDAEAVRKSEANLRAIFDNTDSAYILIDAKKRIVSYNALAQKYSVENNNKKLVVKNHIQEYFSAPRWDFVQQLLEKVSEGETINYELSFVDKNGLTRWYDVRWLNVKDNSGKNWGLILVNKDITEAKIAALEREQITTDLIQHNNHLEQFTYIVSHNLRAPVANIIGLSDLLMDDDLDVDMRHDVVAKVSSSIKNIDIIIQDLNHILQARKPINEKKEKVYFANVVKTIKTSIYNTIINSNVQITCSFDEVDAIFTIRSYLYSIFYNLTSNSIKYCQAGVDPVISITSRQLGNKVELIFKDNGKGIDLDKNGEQLFGLYKRFDTTTEGKGMGLFMVKTQVEALGGTIQIKSKLGEGTEFTIQLSL